MRELTLDRLPRKVLAELDVETVFVASRCVVAAERLLLFRKLQGKELSAAALGRRAGIHQRYCESFLDSLVSLGLLTKSKGLYRNSRLATKHFLEERSVDWTRFWASECSKDYEALSVLDTALSTGKSWGQLVGRQRRPDYQLARQDPQWAKDFTHALYDAHQDDAEALAEKLDLSGHRALLDVGGGSAVMSIALARAHPHLKACVLDFQLVCTATQSILRRERMSRRIRTLVGDMNRALPSGFDVMMFWDIGHIADRVLKRAYRSLPDGGLVVLSCAPSPRRTTPSPDAFLLAYTAVRPRGQTKQDKTRSLQAAGFTSLKYRLVAQGLGMITGRKKKQRRSGPPTRGSST